MQVLTDIRSLATCPSDASLGLVENAALAWDDAGIAWLGRAGALPAEFQSWQRSSAGGALVVPGLVDCHTHLAFGGWRAEEFELRCLGKDYLEIMRQGGGIARTVKDTRAASEAELYAKARTHLAEMAALGVTTVECKSGYGLNLEDELKILRVYRRLAESGEQRIVSTLLGAHVVPPEFRERRSAYVDLLVHELIPEVARERLASFVDVFVEEGAFSLDEAQSIVRAGQRAGLRAKLHADQLGDGGGAKLAAELGAASADHLEHTSESGLEALGRAGVVAVALPLASLYLGQPPLDARRFIAAGVGVAVATDFNPGSAPSYHLPLALTLACTMNHMTPAQALLGATRLAARAVGLEHTSGSLEVGKRADFVLLDAPSVEHWLYQFRANATLKTYSNGRLIWART